MKLLFVGDVIGRPGRRIVQHCLQDLVSAEEAELVVLNCENSAAGFGVTPEIANSLLDLGVDVLTSGNHIWDKKQIFDYFAQQSVQVVPVTRAGGWAVLVRSHNHR